MGDFDKKMNFDLNKSPQKQSFIKMGGEPSHLSDSEEELYFDKTEFLRGIMESDLEVDEKLFLPLNDLSTRDGIRYKFEYKAIKKLKSISLSYYEIKLKNGFYTGFMATIICSKCRTILDSFPLWEKRLLYVSYEHCMYCTGPMFRPSIENYKFVEAEERRSRGKRKDIKLYDVTFENKEIPK